ncbi:MAG: lysophospholipid acyltransferase family protein [Planctomycetota bacterium]|nr:lysophospholipid acyltransferase family protein [Planctomycetota bacterium]MDA1113768.1 lysophospholipid acyltransferase family protein [Planctomycetota bacterium]
MSEYSTGSAPLEWEAPKAGGAFRGIVMILPAFLWAFGHITFLIIALFVAPRWSKNHRQSLLRAWGRGLCWLFGIKLELHGLENRDFVGAKILAVNHVSLVDLFVWSAIWCHPGSILYKREFGRIPLMGRVMRMLGFIEVDRGNREAARASLALAAKRIREEGLTIWIAPEGTRSRLGGLQEFKMGAFHLAMQTQSPIVPSIMRGAEKVNPMGSFIMRSGTVRIDFLPPIPTTGWKRPELRAKSVEVRELFLQFLPKAPDIPA